MRIYEKPKRKKRITKCSYCGNEGHLWMTCPYPREHLLQIERGEQIDLTVFSGNQAKWAFKINKQNGELEPRTDWIKDNAKNFFERQINKKAKRQVKSAKSKTRRCGFCGSPNHNRKNCKVMKNLIDDLAIANQHYRQKLYDCLVGFYGIAEGALVMIRRDDRKTSVSSEKQLAIVQSIDWDSLNLTLDCDTRPFCGDFSMEVVVDGETITSNTPFWFWLEEDKDKSTKLKEFIQQNTYDDTFQILEVLSQSNEKPSENWFMEGYDNCWEWVCKNKSLSEIGSVFADLIEKWCPILKAKRGLEARLRRYRKK